MTLVEGLRRCYRTLRHAQPLLRRIRYRLWICHSAADAAADPDDHHLDR